MRKFLIFCFFFFLGAIVVDTAAAQSYLNPDGSRVNIEIPAGLPTPVANTLDAKIKSYLPTDFEVVDFSGMGEGQNPANWEYDINVKKIYSNTGFTSLLMETYQFTGGAHGSSARIGLVIDNITGKTYTLGDFYDTKKLVRRLSPVWQMSIRNKLSAALEQTLTADEKSWIRDGTTDITHYQSFILTDRVLVVFGQQYQHNAYAYGMQTLVYPLARLQNIRK